jgi:hypothetical protein
MSRWRRNKQLAAYFNVTEMTIWRWKHDPSLDVPPASEVRDIEWNDLDAWDEWMKARAARRTGPEAA